jgi:hypothetical protein
MEIGERDIREVEVPFGNTGVVSRPVGAAAIRS